MTTPDAARQRLVVGHVRGVNPAKWRAIWADRFPRVPLDVVEVPDADARSVLDAGAAARSGDGVAGAVGDPGNAPSSVTVDLVFARLPVDVEGLHRIVLWDEVPAAWVAKDHPVALFDEVTLADLAGETVLTEVDPDSMSQVAVGEAVLLVPQSVARAASRRDLAYRPVTDAEPTTIALLWRRDDENPLIDEFVGIVRGRTANSSRTMAERTARTEPGRERADAKGDGPRSSAGGGGRRPNPRKSGRRSGHARGRGRRPR